jgi:UDP-glucose 4-epimerase
VIDLADTSAIGVIQETVSSTGTPDVVIHAASKQPGVGSLAEFVHSNVRTTSNLLDGLKSSPPTQIIYTSTLSVYAPGVSLPVNENAPPSSPQPYAATKRWAEEVMECWRHSQVTVLRLPSLYGAGQADSFIDGLARLALKGERIELFSRGQLIRDALHVSDIISAIQRCIAQPPRSKFCVMNLGCGRATSTWEYAEALIDALASTSELIASERTGLQRDLWADISFAQQTIGFKPTELRESLRIYGNELRT